MKYSLQKWFVVGLALAVAGGAFAPKMATAQDVSPEVAYRQSLMGAFRVHLGGIQAVTSGAAPAGHAELHAAAFAGMAQALANAFPEGSAAGSQSAPAIWEDRAAFIDQVSAIQSASAQLLAASRSGDSAAIGSAVQAVQGTCRSCHAAYRTPAN